MMKRISFICTVIILLLQPALRAQQFAIVIKGGHVIDPKNNIDQVMDVAIQDGKIVKVERNIDAKAARQVIDAKGLYVSPGLIDLHSHNFQGTTPDHYLSDGLDALNPDGFTFRVGVTTVVDAGSSGWRSFALFKQNVIDHSKTRVLAMLNIVGEGMRGGAYEQDTTDMNAKMLALVANAHKDIIVGIKVAHFEGHEWTAVDHAVAAGQRAHIPVMVDFGGSIPALSLEELFVKYLRKGDIFTHTFSSLYPSREEIIDDNTGNVKAFVYRAREKGIIFDVGYGGISFAFSQAIPAVQHGFYPETISTDIHTGSMNNSMKDMMSVMSKFLVMGMPLKEVIKASTWSPALAVHREALGNLSIGAPADVTVFAIRKGKFGFFDYSGVKIKGKQKFECEATIRDGQIVYDLNGIADPVGLHKYPGLNKAMLKYKL
jgi:dihydroorotase